MIWTYGRRWYHRKEPSMPVRWRRSKPFFSLDILLLRYDGASDTTIHRYWDRRDVADLEDAISLAMIRLRYSEVSDTTIDRCWGRRDIAVSRMLSRWKWGVLNTLMPLIPPRVE
jgi:hypothetical protein